MRRRHVSGARLSAFLDDELGERSAMSTTRHVLACGSCRDELEALRAARTALRQLPRVEAPALFAGVPGSALVDRRRPVLRRLRVAGLVVAVPLTLLAAVYVAGGGAGSDVVPTTDLFVVEHVGRTAGGPVPVPVGDLR